MFKRLGILTAVVLMFATPAFANGQPSHEVEAAGNTNVNTNSNAIENRAVNTNLNAIENKSINQNTVDNTNKVNNQNTQGQSQKQGQDQGQTQGQGQFGYVENDTSIKVDAAPNKYSRQYLGIPEIVPIAPPVIPGIVKDVTLSFPNVGLLPYKGEEIAGLVVEDGNIFSRKRLQDIVLSLLEQKKGALDRGWDLAYVRLQVMERSSSSAFAIGGGLQAGGSALDPTGGTAGMASASVLPSYGRSTADPRYTVFVYYLSGAPVKKVASSTNQPVPAPPSVAKAP